MKPASPPEDTSNSERHTHGPVSGLAQHVPDEWWSSLFGPTYLLTDSDVLTEDITRDEVDRILDLLPLTPTSHILDLCCGQGRHSLELARRGFENLSGLDRSEFLIERAREAASEGGFDELSFQVGDCRQLPHPDASVDAVLLLGNSFGYFSEPEEDLLVLSEVFRVLRPDGWLLLDLASGSYLRRNFEPRSWEWLDQHHLVCREREMTERKRRLVSREVLIHINEGVIQDQFYAERIYDRTDIRNALLECGYANIQIGTAMKTESERNQDLGMMARRFWTTAQPANGTTNEHQVTPPRQVAVILGDPTLPDETKLGGCFDEDDFEVIDKLKLALSSLDGYTFAYFNEHSDLLDQLDQNRDTFDLALNFCDEGLQNRPQWELHVPALLEVLGIPYSGASPQCLASCYDKSLVRGVASEINVPVPPGFLLQPGDPVPATSPVGFPVLVKPNTGDNSAGITQSSVAHGPEEMTAAIDHVRSKVKHNQTLLIEAFLPGKDLTFGLVGNPGAFTRLPITEDDYSQLPGDLPPLCGYEAKWLPDSPYWTEVQTISAELPSDVQSTIEQDSERMFERLSCRDYARFDWRLDAEGKPHLLEVNPNPGWCWDGHMALGASIAGLSYSDLLRLILEEALRRYQIKTV